MLTQVFYLSLVCYHVNIWLVSMENLVELDF